MTDFRFRERYAAPSTLLDLVHLFAAAREHRGRAACGTVSPV
ncbi:hypothetical protein ETTORE_0348 [Pseudomonas phage Ettore]|nr:hypothetical protein ETTORE_0348 [Pseudomonas phage Ettore]